MFLDIQRRPSSYYESIIYWIKNWHNWDIKKEWIINTPGVVPSLSIAVLTYTKPGDKIIIQPPVYHPFYTAIEGNGRELVLNNLKLENDKYVMDFDELESKIDCNTKMIILM